MGVLNITPDSFSDGGQLFQDGEARLDRVRTQALAMLEAGADVLDIGGESSRPGAEAVSEAQELARIAPVLEAISDLPCILSVDTYHPGTARHAVEHGASMINDITGGEDPDMLGVLAESDAAYALMHMQGRPRSMQAAPRYDDVVTEVGAFLAERLGRCLQSGIARNRLMIDPGFGFGKTLEHNLALLRSLNQIRVEDRPVLVGLSRKSMLKAITGREVEDRLAGSLALAVLATQGGADMLRVHNVAETQDALKVLGALATLA